MKGLRFDERGFLYPHQKIKLTMEAFEMLLLKIQAKTISQS